MGEKLFDFDCGEPNCGFQTSGWKTEELRDKRAGQHIEVHETGEPMQELGEFRKENGVEV